MLAWGELPPALGAEPETPYTHNDSLVHLGAPTNNLDGCYALKT
jgi:hypothetical protein